ncbi:hypothetical protein diail_10371 [Diaporthe ilicicola]|nr:hypothetical protein diail_10371 [Diaporthe ilicicola]
MPAQTPTQLADAHWKAVFDEGPYTGVIMLDYLRVQAGVRDWADVLRGGFTNKKGLLALAPAVARRAAIMRDPGLARIWAEQTGRCTSFAVKIITALEKAAPKTYSFNIYDIGNHRVARCDKTGILIDSSAKNGAFQLPEGEWVRIEGSDASWKWIKGKSKFERAAGSSGVKESRTIISKAEALATCLFELIEASSIPTVLRSIDRQTNQASFHCLIKWSWKTKSLDIFPSMAEKRKIAIVFGAGTDQTNTQCIEFLADVVKNNGGPFGVQQWATVHSVQSAIWDAAVLVWGKPTMVETM